MNGKIRVVFDTNIFLSAILFGGNCRTLLELARVGEIQLLVSPFILKEIERKLEEKFNWGKKETEEVLEGILFFAKVVRLETRINKVKNDQSDNHVLGTAAASRAAYLITGDQGHLLPLKIFRKTKIVSPADFLKKFYSQN